MRRDTCLKREYPPISVLDRFVDGSGAWDAPLCLRFGTGWGVVGPGSGSGSESESATRQKNVRCRTIIPARIHHSHTMHVDHFVHINLPVRVTYLHTKQRSEGVKSNYREPIEL